MKPIQPHPSKRESQHAACLYRGFVLLAIFSCIGLDYLAWRKGETSHFFAHILAGKGPPSVRITLAEIVRDSLQRYGIPSQDVEEKRDASGTPVFHVSLTMEAYKKVETDLDEGLREKKATVLKKIEEAPEKTTFSWEARGRKKERVSILFSCLPPIKEKEKEAPPILARNRVAIIIDDMGFNLETLQEICDLGEPITISVLPQSPYAEETARAAHENGLEVMVHLPCESLNNQSDSTDDGDIIHTGMTEPEIEVLMEDFLGRVPFIRGANNHMGSKLTQNEPIMRQILDKLKKRNLFFIDSRTSPDSIAFELSQKMGLRSAYRHVFLDSTVGLDFSKKKIIELFKLSQKSGRAVGIGHPFPETLRALKESAPLFKQYGIEPVFASQIVQD